MIIVNYNGGTDILDCLQSLSAHAPPDFEIIVVDNVSGDGSPDAIQSRFPRVTLIRSAVNVGFGAGNNLGAERARGRYLVFLNPDTIVTEGALSSLLTCLETEKDAGLATSRILMAGDTTVINTCGNLVHLTGITLCRGLGEKSECYPHLEEVPAVSGAAFAIGAGLFQQLGGFDPDMFLYMEDTDLSLRARLSGKRCLYVPGSVVLHRYQLKITPLKIFYQERNRYLTLLKTLRWPTLVLMIPAAFLGEVIGWSFVLFADRRNFRNKLNAYRWVLSNRSSVRSKRKAVQSGRTRPDRDILKTMSVKLDFAQTAPRWMSALAHAVFDPAFWVLKLAALAVVWW